MPGCGNFLWGVVLGAMIGATSATSVYALPIGFNRNQADLEYDEAYGRDFIVYFDRDTPGEGKLTLRALDAARPFLERWTGAVRDRRLPVILSSVTDGASFANFVTDALEIQTMGLGSRALVWHEYTHAMMYRRMDNIFGPAGAIIHLPWMPVWFIEGLAEATSASSGSDFIASVERHQAISGHWPSYDRLHSLYASNFSQQGYAVSGGFVTWLVREIGPEKLPEILQKFRDKSMPWWWPWAAVPFNGFMPMDDSLGAEGRQLYRRYQQWAVAKWAKTGAPEKNGVSAKSQLLAIQANKRRAAILVPGARFDPKNSVFDQTDGWLMQPAPVVNKQDTKSNNSDVGSGDADRYLQRWHVRSRGDERYWMEHRKGRTAFCHRSRKSPASKGNCLVESQFPETIEFLGEDPNDGAVYLARHQHFLLKDSFEVLRWDLGSRTVARKALDVAAVGDLHPVAVARDGAELVMLAAGRKHRYLVWFESGQGRCMGMHRMADFGVAIDNFQLAKSESPESSLLLSLWIPEGRVVKKFSAGDLKKEFPVQHSCVARGGPTSPLLEALRYAYRTARPDAIGRGPKATDKVTPVDFATALALADREPATPDAVADPSSSSARNQPDDAARLEAKAQASVKTRKSRWRGRSVLAFPWIGADDALGPQFGFVSVPLMDHLQNETVRLTFLVGAASRYPNTDLRVLSTRWKPTLSAAVYRQQTYNGIAKTAEDELELSYLDEAGVKFDSEWSWRTDRTTYSLMSGLKRARLKPYLGPQVSPGPRSGMLTELTAVAYASTAILGGHGAVSESIAVRVAPETEESDFAYDSIGAQASIAWRSPLLKSLLRGGVEASRTRGKRMRDLKEVYRPLKTFVPGSGGGLNQNSFGLAGEGWLFAGRYGDTQGRVKAEWTVPLIDDFEKLLWIFYVERLDFSAFLNYGGAWNGPEPTSDRLMAAHGYNVDLQFENKGVRFNFGGGVGQVVAKPWEAYLTFGFDALF